MQAVFWAPITLSHVMTHAVLKYITVVARMWDMLFAWEARCIATPLACQLSYTFYTTMCACVRNTYCQRATIANMPACYRGVFGPSARNRKRVAPAVTFGLAWKTGKNSSKIGKKPRNPILGLLSYCEVCFPTVPALPPLFQAGGPKTPL